MATLDSLVSTGTSSLRPRASLSWLHGAHGEEGIDVGVDVRVHLNGIHDEEGVAGLSPITRVTLAWEARRAPVFFPVMRAEMSFWPLTSTETQLEFEGAYHPPLGALGNLADAALGHRIAEATVHRFLDEIAEQIRRELPATP